MRRDFDGHNALVNYSRLLGTYAQIHHFLGWEILKGVKVSRIVGIYGKSEGDWLWKLIESVVGKLDKNEYRILAPAIFILDLHYRIMEERDEASFHKCNSEFLSNCIKCARLAHGWWSMKRYSLIRLAKSLYAKMDGDGYGAWQNRGDDTVE